MQFPAQILVPAGQETPHIDPSQVAVPPPVGVGQALHDVPQLLVLVFERQLEPHAWKPVLQVNPHDAPSQVAAPLVGTEHAVHDVVPQLAVLAFDTHAPLQA